MDKIRHKDLRNCQIVISDTPRKIDGEGFVLELTDSEFEKCAGIEYSFEVIKASKAEKPEVVIEKPVVVTPKVAGLGKRGPHSKP